MTAPACGADSLSVDQPSGGTRCLAMVSGFVRVALTNSTSDSIGIFWSTYNRKTGSFPDTSAGPGQPISCFKFFAYTWYQFLVEHDDTVGLFTDALPPRDNPGWQVTVTQDSANRLHYGLVAKDTTTFVGCP